MSYPYDGLSRGEGAIRDAIQSSSNMTELRELIQTSRQLLFVAMAIADKLGCETQWFPRYMFPSMVESIMAKCSDGKEREMTMPYYSSSWEPVEPDGSSKEDHDLISWRYIR